MVALIFACLAVIAIILFLRFVLWYHMTVLFLILFSPDYLVIGLFIIEGVVGV